MAIGEDEMNPLDVIILRSQDIFSDSRVLRYEAWYKKNQITYRIIGWDRQGKNLKRDNTEYYDGIAGFQQGAKGILGRIKWNWFLLGYLFSYRRDYKIIHACDFDTVMPSLVMKLFGKKVVFDIFDWFSDEVKTGKWYIDKPINFMEKLSVKLADLVIICEKGRLQQMEIVPSHYIVVPNIPVGNGDSVMPVDGKSSCHYDDYSIAIAYIGGLVEHRGLRELVNVISRYPNIRLNIAGFGDEAIIKYMTDMSEKFANIYYYGKIPYGEALSIMKQSDLLYAMYYKTNPNHLYAAPNKFYEALFLAKPIITTNGTLVGDKVESIKSGYVIDEGEKAFEDLLDRIISNGIRGKMDFVRAFEDEIAIKNGALLKYKKIIFQ